MKIAGVLTATAALLLLVSSAPAQTLEPVPVIVKGQVDWVMLPPTPDDPDSPAPVITYAAVPISRAVDPETGKPYVEGWPHDCDPNDVCHTFRLEKREFLLGEPILVEYRVSLDGPGTYSEGAGGNYRSRGRDDNFLFLLRREDGAWVREVHPFSGGPGGGMGGNVTAKQGEPISLWSAAQRWAAIEEPGRYDLYCLYMARYSESIGKKEAFEKQIPAEILRTHTVDEYGQLFKVGTTEKSDTYVVESKSFDWNPTASPLLAKMPGEVMGLLDDFTIQTPNDHVRQWSERAVREHIERATAFAHVPIVIRRGTAEQEEAMVEDWIRRGTQAIQASASNQEYEAVLTGIYFVLQPYFLNQIQDWQKTDPDHLRMGGRYYGLGFNPHVEATAILLRSGHENSGYGTSLRPDLNSGVMADFIELLTHQDPTVSSQALHLMRMYSGSYFFADPEGGPLETLSDSQMNEAQELWRTWWSRNAAGFRHVGSSGAWGYIDKTGTMVIPPRFAWGYPFQDGVAPVLFTSRSMGEHDRSCIDRTGALADCPESPAERAPLRPVRVDDRSGFEDRDGTLVIPAQFEWAYGFSEGLAAVAIDGKYGFIDMTGEFVIPPQFDRTREFIDGKATVEVNGRSGIIDRNGHYILQTKYASLGRIVDDRVSFRVGQQWGFLDSSGNVAIKPQFTHVEEFKEGIAQVYGNVEMMGPNAALRSEPRRGFIDRTGNVIGTNMYADVRDFAGGLAAVNTHDWQQPLWGYIDHTGKMVIPAQFSGALSFSEGLAAVQLPKERGGKWGFIDTSGTMVIAPQFESATEFSEGLAAVSLTSPHYRLDPEDYR
jgi:hypothetical protein